MYWPVKPQRHATLTTSTTCRQRHKINRVVRSARYHLIGPARGPQYMSARTTAQPTWCEQSWWVCRVPSPHTSRCVWFGASTRRIATHHLASLVCVSVRACTLTGVRQRASMYVYSLLQCKSNRTLKHAMYVQACKGCPCQSQVGRGRALLHCTHNAMLGGVVGVVPKTTGTPPPPRTLPWTRLVHSSAASSSVMPGPGLLPGLKSPREDLRCILIFFPSCDATVLLRPQLSCSAMTYVVGGQRSVASGQCSG